MYDAVSIAPERHVGGDEQSFQIPPATILVATVLLAGAPPAPRMPGFVARQPFPATVALVGVLAGIIVVVAQRVTDRHDPGHGRGVGGRLLRRDGLRHAWQAGRGPVDH